MENKTLAGLVLVALAIVFHALAARYDVIALTDSDFSAIYRIDRLTGRMWICANDQCLKVQDIDKKQAGQRTSAAYRTPSRRRNFSINSMRAGMGGCRTRQSDPAFLRDLGFYLIDPLVANDKFVAYFQTFRNKILEEERT